MKKALKYITATACLTLLLGGMTACGESRAPNLPQLSSPTDLYLSINLNYDQTEYLFTWDMVKEADSYTISVDGNVVAEDIEVYIEEYDLTSYLTAGNQHEISITALSEYDEYTNSTPAVLSCTAEIPTKNLEYVYHNKTGGYEVFRGKAPFNLQYLVIPDFYNEMPVTNVGNFSFGGIPEDGFVYDQPYLKRIRFPKDLVSIGDGAFGYCINLENIDLPKSITKIGTSAFAYCNKATMDENVFCETLNYIGVSAFRNCPAITEIIIPERVNYIGNYAFANCKNLSKITVLSTDFEYMGNAFYNTPWLNAQPNGYICFGNVLYTYKGDLPENTVLTEFPKGITQLAGYAFAEQKNLIGVTIPEGWETTTGNYAFSNCKSLKSVSFPDSFKRIEDGMFRNCKSLTEIVFPQQLAFIGKNAFSSCSSLKNILLPETVTEIGSAAFWGCTQLSTINFPAQLHTISESMLEACINLTNITIPETVKRIEALAFFETGITSVFIPKSVQEIGQAAFSVGSLQEISVSTENKNYCSIDGNLYTKNGKILLQYASGKTDESFTIPNEVTDIGNYAFFLAVNLKNVVFSENLKRIGECAFYESALTKAVLPDGVLYIEISSFSDCINLTEVVIPDSVTSIGEGAFYGCSSLTKIVIPDEITTITIDSFKQCSSLTSVVIGDGVTLIKSGAFSGCTSLTSVIIGNSVTRINSSVFFRCDSLAIVYYHGSLENWNKITVKELNTALTNATVYFYSESEPPLNSDGTAYNGNYWHYAEDGITPVVWEL